MARYIQLIHSGVFSVMMIMAISLHGRAQTYFYSQTLDHFGAGTKEATITFPQQFVIDGKFWSGAQNNGPIIVMFGGEAPIKGSLNHIGILSKSAPSLRALVLYIEHRFYGSSIPLGSIDLALQTPSIRNCLNSQQAMEDYAKIILSVKANLSANHSPVIVIGGSYAGMLAAWFRIKYPHVAIGALASSAPLFLSEKLPEKDEYCSIVNKDFEQTNGRCHGMIMQSWSLMDQMGSLKNGLDLLKQKLNLCIDVNSLEGLKQYMVDIYSFVAQYNGINNYWINIACDAIVDAPNSDILVGIGKVISIIHKHDSCHRFDSSGAPTDSDVLDENSQKAWNWQGCSEIIQHKECTGHNQIFPQTRFDLTRYKSYCQLKYGVFPTPFSTSTYYRGEDIKTGLSKFGSNIIFSNGLMDPLSGASILHNISDTIVAINTEEGSHCLDFNHESSHDPKWLKIQREKEIQVFREWITKYENKTGVRVDFGLAGQTSSNNVIIILLCMLVYWL